MATPALDPQAIYQRALELQQQALAGAADTSTDDYIAEVKARAAANAAARAEAERNRNRTAGEVGKDALIQLGLGGLGLGEAALGLADIATLGTLQRFTPLDEGLLAAQQSLQSKLSVPTQESLRRTEEAFKEGVGAGLSSLDLRGVQNLVLQALPSLTVPAAAGVRGAALARAAGKTAEEVAQISTQAALRGGAAQAAGVADIEATRAAEEAGATPGEAQLAGLIAAPLVGAGTFGISKLTGAGALEAAVGRRIAGEAGLAAQTVPRALLTGGAKETAEESAQSALEQAVQNLVTPGAPLGEGVAQQAVLGGIAGGLIGAPLGVYARSPRRPSPLRDEIDQTTDALGAEVGVDTTPPLMDVTEREAPRETIDLTLALPEQEPLPAITDLPEVGTVPLRDLEQIRLTEAIQPPEPAPEGIPLPEVTDEITPVEVQAEKARQLLEIQAKEDLAREDKAARIQQTIRQTTGQERAPAAKPLSKEEADVQEQERQLGILQSILFDEKIDPETDEVRYTRYNADLQVLETLTPEEARATTQAAFDRAAEKVGQAEKVRAAAAAEAAKPPSDRWKTTLAKEFGFIPKGGVWSAFKAAADELGITPDSPEATAFLVAQANALVTETETSKFGVALGTNYGTPEAAAAAPSPVTTEAVAVTEEVAPEAVELTEPTEPVTSVFDVTVEVSEEYSRMSEAFRQQKTATDLDELFTVMKRSPEFQALPTSEQLKLEDEFSQLHFDMEEVGRFQRAEPDPKAIEQRQQELETVQAGLEGKTAEQWADWLSKNAPTADHKLIARKILLRLRQLMAAGYTFETRIVHVGDTAPRSVTSPSTKGLTTTAIVGGGIHTTIYLKGVDTGIESTTYETAIHELIHAVTEPVLRIRAEDIPADISAAAKDLANVADAIVRHVNSRIAAGEDQLTDFERKLYQGRVNAASTMAEVMAWTLTNREMQAYLETIPYESKTAWTAFVEAVRKFLGLPPAKDTALSEVLRTSDALLSAALPAGFAPESIIRKFSRSEGVVSTPMGLDAFTNTVSDINAGRPEGSRIVPYDSVADYMADTGKSIPEDTKGVYDSETGQISVIRRNIKDPTDLAVVVAHERGHEGLRGLLGDRLTAITNRLWANAALRDRIKAKMDTQQLSRAVAAEEVLADMIAGDERLPKSVWTKVRNAVRDVIDGILGLTKLRKEVEIGTITNEDVNTLLKDTVDFMRGEQTAAVKTRLTADEANAILDDLTTDPQKHDSRLRLSVAGDRLSELVGKGSEPSPPSFNSATQQIFEASRKGLKTVQGAARGGGALRGIKSFAPLQWLTKWYGGMFDRPGQENPLQRLYDENTAKSGAHNRILTGVQDFKYFDGKNTLTFNTSVQAIGEQWAKLPKARAEAVDILNQFGTLYRLHPDRSFDDQSKLNYETVGFDEAERRQAYNDLRKAWERAGKDGQAVYQQAQAVYKKLWDTRFEELANEITRTTGLEQYLTDESGKRVRNPRFWEAYGNKMESALNKLRNGPYSPLSRYGRYTVAVRDADGKIVWFSGHESQQEQRDQAAHVRNLFPNKDTHRVVESTMQEFEQTLDGLRKGEIESIRKGVKDTLNADIARGLQAGIKDGLIAEDTSGAVAKEIGSEVYNTIVDGLMEAYLQSLPQHAFLQHANQRKGVAGFTMDSFRAFNDYAFKAAHTIASLQHDGNIARAITGMQQAVRDAAKDQTDAGITNTNTMQDVVSAAKEQQAAARDTSRNKIADFATGYTFLHMMSSPAQMLINASQTFMVALPRMGAEYKNVGGAVKAVKDGMKLFVASGRDLLGPRSKLDSTTRQLMEKLREDGTLDFTQVHSFLDFGGGGPLGTSRAWHVISKVGSYFMHKSEVFNRQITAYASIQLQMQRDGVRPGEPLSDAQMEKYVQRAKDDVLTSHGDYSKENRPPVLQGPWKRMFFQFQTYRLHMLSMLAYDLHRVLKASDSPTAKEDKKVALRTLSYMLATQLATVGATGTILSPLVFGLMDLFRDDDDLLDAQSEAERALPQWLAFGIFSKFADMSRVSPSGILPIFGDRQYAPKDATGKEEATYWAMRALGPSVSLLVRSWDGVNDMGNGDFEKGTRKILPALVRDAYGAVADSAEGVRNSRGLAYFEPDEFDTLFALFGLKSGERKQADIKRGAAYEAQKHAETVRGRYKGRMVTGVLENDSALIQETLGDIKAWNAKFPDLAITDKDILQAVKGRLRSEALSKALGVPTGSAIKPSIVEAAGL